ncbi:MAG: hypothetical protein VW238_05020 [Nitrosomonadales bacterium]
MMFKPEQIKMFLELYSNPLFRESSDYFIKHLQKEGMVAAKKFWMDSPYAKMFPHQDETLEQLFEFYKAMGFVPLAKYEKAEEEIASLRKTINELNNEISQLKMAEIHDKNQQTQDAWKDVLNKQIELNKQATTGFFKALDQFQTNTKKPKKNIKK